MHVELKNGKLFNDSLTWKHCPCGIHDQEGLPCPHMLAIMRSDRDLKIEETIRRRWLLPEQTEEEKKKIPKTYVGHPRVSRRNTIK